jgi:hypothetical protein
MAGKKRNMEPTNPREDDRNEEVDEPAAPDPEEGEPRPEDDPQAD